MNEVVDHDRAVRLARQAQHVPGSAARDVKTWGGGPAAEDRWQPRTGNQFLQSLWQGHMSPLTRTLVGLAGGGLFLYGLTQKAPLACVLGTVGFVLATEAFANASIEDIAQMSERTADIAGKAASRVGESLSFNHPTEQTGHGI